MKKIFYLFYIFIYLYGCQESEVSKYNKEKQISVNFYEDSFGSAKIKNVITLENTIEGYIGRVERIFLDNNRIYILDGMRRKMMLFDDLGQHLHTVSTGKGPGELVHPSDFEYTKEDKTILIWDLAGIKLESYDQDLNYLGNKLKKDNIILAHWFIHTADEKWVTYNGSTLSQDGNDYFTYVLRNSNFNPIRGLLPFGKDWEDYTTIYNPFSREMKDEILLCRRDNNNIYYYNAEKGELSLKYYIDFGLHQFPDNSDLSTILELHKTGKAALILGDIINSMDYFALSSTFKSRQEYFIYQKSRGNVRSSLAINDLPYGVLKGMVNEDTFILIVDPIDYLEFIDAHETDAPKLEGLKEDDNYLLVLFTIE